MRFGLSTKEYKFINDNAVFPLQKLGAKIWVFGSRARNDHQDFSDLDIYIESKTDFSNLISEIDEILINSDISIKVDLVQSNHFAESYRDSLNKDKILWT